MGAQTAQGRLAGVQGNLVSGIDEDQDLLRLRIGTDDFFCRLTEFTGSAADNRRTLERLARAGDAVQAGWVPVDGRREIVWLVGAQGQALAASPVVRQAAWGLLTGLLGAAALIGAIWAMVVFLDEAGPFAGAAGWWALPVIAGSSLLGMGGLCAVIVALVTVPRGLSRARRRAYAAFRDRTGLLSAQAPSSGDAARMPDPLGAAGNDTSARAGGLARGLECHEGRIESVAQATRSTLHVSGASHAALQRLESEHVAIRLAGVPALFVLRTSSQGQLFLHAGDLVRIVGRSGEAGVDVLGLRNLTDGAGYLPVPGRVLQQQATHVLGGVIAAGGLGFIGVMAWDGQARAADYREVALALGMLLGIFYAVVALVRRTRWRSRRDTEHAQPGSADDMADARGVLGLPRRGGAVPL